MLTLSIFAVLIALLVLNVPVVVAIGMTSVMFFTGLGDGRMLAMLPHRMYYGTTGFTLLAIPFFILAGNLMNVGGITDRIFRFASAMVGHISGGLGQVNIVASVIFSGMSGSAVADAAGLGQIEHKAMVDAGYHPADSATLVAVSSVIGPVIPPSIPFVLYGAITSVSVARLFMAGFIPGILMSLGMMLALATLAKRRHYPRAVSKAPLRYRWQAFKEAFWPLMAPVIIIGGIMSGFFTPTEASVVVCIYALFLGFFYRDLKIRDLPDINCSGCQPAVYHRRSQFFRLAYHSPENPGQYYHYARRLRSLPINRPLDHHRHRFDYGMLFGRKCYFPDYPADLHADRQYVSNRSG